jgi:hypothetical protein
MSENARFQLKTAKNYPKPPVIPAKAGIQCPHPKKVTIYPRLSVGD